MHFNNQLAVVTQHFLFRFHVNENAVNLQLLDTAIVSFLTA